MPKYGRFLALHIIIDYQRLFSIIKVHAVKNAVNFPANRNAFSCRDLQAVI